MDPQTLVREAVRRWQAQLIDLGGRNTLLYYRDLRAGTLDLGRADIPDGAGVSTCDSVARAALLNGRALPLAQLFPAPDAHVQAVRRARTIRNKARELAEERGIETCYLAIGMATWDNRKTGGASVPAAPVLLRSASLRARGAAEGDFDLAVAAEAELNPTLLHLLREDFGVELDAGELEELIGAGFDPAPVYERLRKAAAGQVPGFEIAPRFVLGTFSYAKLPMVVDLHTAEQVLAGHPVIAAIAGDAQAQRALRPDPTGIDPRTPDYVDPADEFLVLDADSSQNQAINAVLAGRHSVIKGPPGTGKSQTIANLIASLVARGKRVLFVAEKRAAITAVTDRLAKRGLGQLVMDVHDGTTSRRQVAAELRAALESTERIALPELTELHETLTARRSILLGYSEALHTPREPWGVSVYQARTALAALSPALGAATPAKLRGATLSTLDSAVARRTREQLREFATLGGLAPAEHASVWAGASVPTPHHAQRAFELAEALAERLLPAVRPLLSTMTEQTGLRPPHAIEGWRARFTLLDGVAATLRGYRPEVYASDLAGYVAALAPRSWRRANPGHPGVRLGWFARRRARKQATALWGGAGRPARTELFAGLSAALAQREQWLTDAVDGGLPRLPAVYRAAAPAFGELDAALRELAAYTPHLPLSTMDLDGLARVLVRLVGDERALRRMPRIGELAATFRALGLDPLLAALAGRSDPEFAAAYFDASWYASILSHVDFTDPRIGAFDGASHSRVVAEFQAADTRHLDATADRVLRRVAEHVTSVRDAYPEQSRLVEHQAGLKRRHLPIRQLFAAAPHVLTALKPCWAMSPLVVSQLLPTSAGADRAMLFDVVIFDEASQVTPADAVPSLVRAGQVVVAGDEHQLPPTAFFTAAEDGGEDPVGVTADGGIDLSLTAGYESILDVLSALLPFTMLRWHYRSRDDRLIGFSNAHIYGGGLVTFPGVAGEGTLSLVPVKQDLELDDEPDSVGSEVRRVVDLVLEHAATRPAESLGVITMGIAHAERIDTSLRRALATRPDLHGYFAERAAEPFFVKNLERVQGDERDAVILSVGYGKGADGKLRYRFGPLLMAGGERRLNVAITRARKRMTVVSAFTAADMDPARSAAEGVRLLRAYLEYAESGGVRLGVAAPHPPLNPFEIDVRDRLSAAGIPLTPQYGVAGYRIDFAAAHPSLPGQMVLAIEADGASYHSCVTARDRDRLRQQQLERLGWRFHRIWSTDWFADPAAEVARARAAYDEAVAAVDARLIDEPTVVLPPPEPASGEPDAARGSARTAPRPDLVPGRPIGDYAFDELVALVRWIESDTLLRTEEQVLAEARRELGFKRGGPRINAAIQAAIVAVRSVRP